MNENNNQIKVIDTYADDMAEVLENDSGGLVRKIIHGEEEHEAELRNLSPESKKNSFFIIISTLLLLAALSTIIFFIFRKNDNSVMVESQFVPIIFNDKSTTLDISGFNKDKIAQTVADAVASTSATEGELEGIYLTENGKLLGMRRLLALLKANFNPGNSTELVADKFLIGVVNRQASPEFNSDLVSGPGFFMLIKMRSISDIFDSMHAWEQKMFSDLHGLMGISLSSNTNFLLTKNFEDSIIDNKNARILYDTNGKIVMMYIFADDNSVIITDRQEAAHEVMLRLASSRAKQ